MLAARPRSRDELIARLGGNPSLAIGSFPETHNQDIEDIPRESLEYDQAASSHYWELFRLCRGHSVLL
jgi:hypothetical protein